MVATLYEPINVYKPLAPAIGVVDGPIEYLTSAGLRMPMPFTTRMTVIRLENGDLFLHSPIAFDQGLADELSRLEMPASDSLGVAWRASAGSCPQDSHTLRPRP